MVVAAAALARPENRAWVTRSARVARLSTRRAIGYGALRIRGAAADEAKREELEAEFAIRSADDVVRELGNMKGALMKAGQLVSYIVEGLPDEVQQSLASLQADVPPMSPKAAAAVMRGEFGEAPERLFLDWPAMPAAAASIGQVHKATTNDGRIVAVKVQYPGIDTAIGGDLKNAELLYRMMSAFALKNLDVRSLVDELSERLVEELDYRLEADRQQEFADRYAGHPFIRIPRLVPERSGHRVLTTEWVDGMTWTELQHEPPETRQRVAETLFRFYQGAIYRGRVFNGDPHPGNFRFHDDGSVTFLDFGLVKRWSDDDVAVLWPLIDPLLAGDAARCVELMIDAEFLVPDHGLDPQHIFDYVSTPYRPFMQPTFEFSRTFTRDSLRKIVDVNGPYADVIEKVNMPASFVILDRVVWGMCAILGQLGADNAWQGMLAEYREDGPPVTPMGEAERTWWHERGQAQHAAADLDHRR